MNQNLALRLTPRASPAPRTPVSRSPIKTIREEPQWLSLKKIVGNTVASPNAVSCTSDGTTVAYLAGATAVVVSRNDDGSHSQRAFRANTSTSLGGAQSGSNDSPIASPIAPSQRSRPSAIPRELALTPLSFSSPRNEAQDSPNSRAAALRLKSKTATCVAISPDGKWLAMGEMGFKPRILIFSMARDGSTDGPVSALAEHSYGVKCLAFSSNSQYLASLGDINDGFLHIWNIHQKTGATSLHASNKCTSNVRAMAWTGTSLVTIGTRHVKTWRLDTPQASPSKRFDATFSLSTPSKSLSGRNCILGPLLDKTYSAIVPFDQYRAFICSDDGDLCLLDSADTNASFRQVAKCDGATTAACLGPNATLVIANESSGISVFGVEQLLASTSFSEDSTLTHKPLYTIDGSRSIAALVPARESALAFFTNGTVSSVSATGTVATTAGLDYGHCGDIRGIKEVSMNIFPDAAFVTFAPRGTICLWDHAGAVIKTLHVTLNENDQDTMEPLNELRAIAVSCLDPVVFVGDAFGHLKAVSAQTSVLHTDLRVHADEVTSLDTCEFDSRVLVASASRDRTVQVFSIASHTGSLDLLQTLEDHIGAVTNVKFSRNGTKLISCSSDRSILVRTMIQGSVGGFDKVAYVPYRTITLKATPIAMQLSRATSTELLVVSTMDKTVTQFNIEDGGVAETFRADDGESGESVNLNYIVSLPGSAARTSNLIAGVAASDRSLRLYSASGTLLGRDFGQTEGLTGVISISNPSDPSDSSVVTTAADGTVFIWNIFRSADDQPTFSDPVEVSEGTPKANAFFAARPPLRRVLSSSELLKLQDSAIESPSVGKALRERSRSPKRRTAKAPLPEKIDSSSSASARSSRRNKNASDPSEVLINQKTRTTRSRPSSPPGSPRKSQAKSLPKLRKQSSQPALSTLHKQKSRDDFNLTSPTLLGGANDLVTATRQVCRSLHSYRRKLASSDEPLPAEHVKDLERELGLTAKALADKAARSEAVLEKLLDRYGERLVEIMERRIDEKVGKLVEQGQVQKKAGNDEEMTKSVES